MKHGHRSEKIGHSKRGTGWQRGRRRKVKGDFIYYYRVAAFNLFSGGVGVLNNPTVGSS